MLWVLVAELIFWRMLLPYPIPELFSLLPYYLILFGSIGIGSGVMVGLFPGLGRGFMAGIIGGVLAFLMVGLRIYDLTDTSDVSMILIGLLILISVVIVVIAMLISRISDQSTLRTAPSGLLAGSIAVAVLTSKILVTTTPIPVPHPLPTALLILGLFPILLVPIYGKIMRKVRHSSRMLIFLWLMPLIVLLFLYFVPRFRSASPASSVTEVSNSEALPPIIWITVDALRWDHMSLYGYDIPTTPNLEAFARGATVYSNCLAQSSGTGQSVPSMLSGTTPYRHGGVCETRRLPEAIDLLPELLRDHGYHTIAQSANHWVSPRYGMGQGFEEFIVHNTDNELFIYDIMKLLMRLAPWEVFRMREFLPSYAYVPIRHLIDESIEILKRQNRARPFFLYLQPIDPHGPYQPPFRYVHPDKRSFHRDDYISYWDLKPGVTVNPAQREIIVALYDGEIAYSDAELGRFFEALHRMDLFEPSMIIITSDHGEHFQEHGFWRHSNSLYQELVHIPLIIKDPYQSKGQVINHRVASIDIAPTILDIIGVRYDSCEGIPLEDVTTGLSRPIFIYIIDCEQNLPTRRSVILNGWKLILTEEDGSREEELFHIESDPVESENLRDKRPEIVRHLIALLSEYEKEVDSLRGSEISSPHPADRERLRSLGYIE